MAYQPKSYRKFLVGAVTTAVVASSFTGVAGATDVSDFKDVNDSYKEAVSYLVSKGISGISPTEFGTYQNIKRVDAAVFVVKALGLDVNAAPASGFTDVPERAVKEVNALKAAGITNGKSETTFGAQDYITRGELAKWLVAAFELEGTADISAFGDVPANYTDAISTLVANKITSGTSASTFGTYDNAKRGDFAKFILASSKVVPVPVVESVSATNEKTLSLTGTGLKNLKAESITLANNEVASVTPAADGKSASVTFKHNFPLDQEQTVKIEQEGTKEFKFTYSLAEIKSVELDAKAYDDDTKGQLVTFKVNGQSTSADADFLRQAGYTVKFVAVDKDGKAATNFFAGSSASESTTGLLADKVTVGNYTVEVQLMKAGKVVLSDKKVLSVTDLESTSKAIKTVELTDDSTTLVKNSTTLVAGEKATITDITGDAANKTNVSLPVGLAQVTSSNSAVVSVADNKLTANAPGTAVITVKIGNATKDVTITVTNKERVLNKVTSTETSVKVVKGQTRIAKVSVLDQYGDVIPAGQLSNDKEVTVDAPQNSASDKLVTVPATLTVSTLTITGAEVGSGTILFKDPNGKVIGQIAAQVTDVDNVASYKVEYAATSTIVKDSFAEGKSAVYQFSKFNTNGFFNGVATLVDSTTTGNAPAGQFKVESANPKVATVTVDTDGTAFTVAGVKAGTTDITIKNDAGQIVTKFTVTITEAPVVITKVNFKATSTVDYVGKKVNVADVLDVREDGNNDNIVYGIEHNAATIEKVRLASTGDAVAGQTPGANNLVIYIDNGTETGSTAGKLDANDTVLGVVKAEVLSGSTTATAGIPIAEITDITVGTTADNYATVSKDKGQILFRVLEDGTKVTSTIASTTLSVDVK